MLTSKECSRDMVRVKAKNKAPVSLRNNSLYTIHMGYNVGPITLLVTLILSSP